MKKKKNKFQKRNKFKKNSLTVISKRWKNIDDFSKKSLIFSAFFVAFVFILFLIFSNNIFLKIFNFTNKEETSSETENYSRPKNPSKEIGYTENCSEGTISVPSEEFGFFHDGKYFIPYANAIVKEDEVEKTDFKVNEEMWRTTIIENKGCVPYKEGAHHSWNEFTGLDIYKLKTDDTVYVLKLENKYIPFHEFNKDFTERIYIKLDEWILDSSEIILDDVKFDKKIKNMKEALYNPLGNIETGQAMIYNKDLKMYSVYTYCYIEESGHIVFYDKKNSIAYDFTVE